MENTINFNLSTMGSSDIESMHLVIDAFKNLDANDQEIMEGGTGYNNNSGYVYICLENGISICSCFGQDIDYLVTDFESGEEFFMDSYTEAVEKMESFNYLD